MHALGTSLHSLLLAAALTACSTKPTQQTERSDASAPDASTSLRGQQVVIDCHSADSALSALCSSALLREVAAAGGLPVPPPSIARGPSSDARRSEALAALALDVGAAAVFTISLNPGPASHPRAEASVAPSPGGFKLGSSDAEAGGGPSASIVRPIPPLGLMGHGQVTDPRTGRALWRATFSASASSDLGPQSDALVASLTAAAKRAGLF